MAGPNSAATGMPDPAMVTVPSRNATPEVTCAGPGCEEAVPRTATGRPGRFCSGACRSRAHRRRQRPTEPLVAEVDFGSASSRGRAADQAWMVRLRRGDKWVIVAIGLRRPAADRLAEAITDLLGGDGGPGA